MNGEVCILDDINIFIIGANTSEVQTFTGIYFNRTHLDEICKEIKN